MRRLTTALIVTMALCWESAPAYAQGWRWLEKLSGPGDFSGLSFDQKLFCSYDEKEKAGAGDPQGVVEPEGIGFSAPCLNRPRDGQKRDLTRRRWATGVGVSYLRGDNDLLYEPVDTHVDRTVSVYGIEGFFDHRLGGKNSRIDGGVAVGLNIFDPRTASSFVKVSVEPRVTFKLFDLRVDQKFVGTFAIRVGALVFLDGFEAEDFGALPGTYSSGGAEAGLSLRMVFDFDRNPFKRRDAIARPKP